MVSYSGLKPLGYTNDLLTQSFWSFSSQESRWGRGWPCWRSRAHARYIRLKIWAFCICSSSPAWTLFLASTRLDTSSRLYNDRGKSPAPLSCNFYLKSPLYIYIINATCSWHAILHIVNIEFGDIKYYKSTGGPLKPTSPRTYKGPSALRMDRKSRQYGTPWMNRWMRELQSTNSSSRSRLTNGPSIDRWSSKSFVNQRSHTRQTYI
jgi:hypothetical protein